MNFEHNRQITINSHLKKILSDLLNNEFESGGYLNNNDQEITSLEIYSGNGNAVHYPQYKPCGDNRITFHTHPRTSGTQHLKFLPPSVDDIISYTLANAYVYPEIKRTALVIGKEGVYTLQVVRKRKPDNILLTDYLKEAYILLYSIWSYYNDHIWYDDKILFRVFDYIRIYFGVDIKYFAWQQFNSISLDYSINTQTETYEDFNRNSIAIYTNIFPNLDESNLLFILQEYEFGLK